MTTTVIRYMPGHEFAKAEGISAGAVKVLLESALEYGFRRNNPPKHTDAMDVGAMFHCATLEPERVDDRFAYWPKANGRRGTNKHKEWVAEQGGKILLTEDDYRRAAAMAIETHAHGEAGALLDEPGDTELSIFWTHEETGLPMKSRLDRVCSHIVEPKSAASVKPRKFQSDAYEMGYHAQLALQSDAYTSIAGEVLPTAVIAVQSSAPHDVVTFHAGDDYIDAGRKAYEHALRLLIRCRETNTWPGIAPEGMMPLGLPPWAAQY